MLGHLDISVFANEEEEAILVVWKRKMDVTLASLFHCYVEARMMELGVNYVFFTIQDIHGDSVGWEVNLFPAKSLFIPKEVRESDHVELFLGYERIEIVNEMCFLVTPRTGLHVPSLYRLLRTIGNTNILCEDELWRVFGGVGILYH